ncbi:biotin carboxylase N-terminal domain-containing protein [Nocardioides soli]
MTHRVFVANRGEIAVRIIEACDRLGFETVPRRLRRPTATPSRPGAPAGC